MVPRATLGHVLRDSRSYQRAASTKETSDVLYNELRVAAIGEMVC